MKYFYPCKPQRLQPDSPFMDRLDNDPQWIAEIKMNGFRCLPTVGDHQAVTLWSRHKTILTFSLIQEGEALLCLPPRTILDGELLNFKRISGGINELHLFDILMLDGMTFYDKPYYYRRLMLERVFKKFLAGSGIVLTEQFYEHKKQLYFDSIDKPETEGIVLKKFDSPYLVSERTCLINPLWLKVKRPEKHTRR